MKASKDTVVSFHYELHEAGGELIENSREQDQPMLVLLGHGQLIPGMEAALEGRESGEAFEVELAPEEAYGEHRDDLIQRVPKKYFPQPKHLKTGQVTSLALRSGGRQQVTVRKIGMSTVDVDINHPLAGKTLQFAIEVVEVRGATPEELAHGHAHRQPPPAATEDGEAPASA